MTKFIECTGGVIIWNSIEIKSRNYKDLKLFKVRYKQSFSIDMIVNAGVLVNNNYKWNTTG